MAVLSVLFQIVVIVIVEGAMARALLSLEGVRPVVLLRLVAAFALVLHSRPASIVIIIILRIRLAFAIGRVGALLTREVLLLHLHPQLLLHLLDLERHVGPIEVLRPSRLLHAPTVHSGV